MVMHFLVLHTLYKEKQARKVWQEKTFVGSKLGEVLKCGDL